MNKNAGTSLAIRGGKQRRNGQSPKDRLSLGEKVLAGRNNGQTMPMIARELNISVPSAYRYMDLALAVRIPPTVDDFRAQQNDRLDQTQREITTQIDAANYLVQQAMKPDDEGRQNAGLLLEALKARDRAIALQLSLDNRRAKLNGLDAPVKVEATVDMRDPREEELAEMMRQAREQMEKERTDG